MMLKIGLLTSIREDHFLPGENFLKRYMANLAPLYLVSYLEKSGIRAEVIIKDRLEDLIPFQPEILGISSVTENFEFAKKCAARAKSLWNPLTIIGGVHITSLPATLPQEFDIGVVGEGEETFCDLIGLLEKNPQPSEDALSRIPSIVFHSSQGIHRTKIRKGIAHLDEIPLLPRKRFIRNMGTTYMMTSRGCPYTCSFCVIPQISEGYRKHSPEYVVAEVASIKRDFPGVQSIRLFDDLFVVDRPRVAQIADRLDAEGLNHDLTFGCWARANLIDDRMVKAFQKMNMLYVAFGAESGSSRVLSQLKPGVSVQQNQAAIDRLYDGGVRVSCSVILGHPQETEDDLWATYEFIEKNLSKLLEIEFNAAIPWPGTDLWEGAKQRGIVADDMNFNVLKECAYFPNYCTDLYPYLNEKIAPERFDSIMVEFKKLYKKMMFKIEQTGVGTTVNPGGEVSCLY